MLIYISRYNFIQSRKQPENRISPKVDNIAKTVGNISITPNEQAKSTSNKNVVLSATKNNHPSVSFMFICFMLKYLKIFYIHYVFFVCTTLKLISLLLLNIFNLIKKVSPKFF